MNTPPEDAIRVSPSALREFVADAGRAAGLPDGKATRLAEMLTGNDLRGVFSHGTRQIATYTRLLRAGELNPDPHVEVIKESPVSVQVDGDGGLGYFPTDSATNRAIEKAKDQGIAAMATRNHGHFGAAGLYTRQSADEDLLAFVTSGVQLNLSPGDPIYSAAGGSPMSFCAPADEENDLVLDFGTMHDLYSGSPHRDAIAELAPGLVLRSIGLGMICQSWGGLLTGRSLDADPEYQEYDGANQGSFGVFLRLDLFSEPERFKREMDAYATRVQDLDPIEGFDPHLPGGPEAERLTEYRQDGIPVGPDHRETLEATADEFGLDMSWT